MNQVEVFSTDLITTSIGYFFFKAIQVTGISAA